MRRGILKIAIGLLLVVTVLIGYMSELECLVELTSVSNISGGLLLIIDGILNMTKKKSVPPSFYLCVCATLLFVFIICAVSLSGIFKFNFQGAFFFMHVINPIAFLLCYLLFVNERKRKARYVLTSPFMIIIYLLFDYILGNARGDFVYGFVQPSDLNLFYAALTAFIMYAVVYVIGLALFYLNRFAHRKTPSCP